MNREQMPGLPLGEEKALEAIEFGLQTSAADATEILVAAENTDLTRFANLAIHQNVAETHYQVYFRTVWDGRLVIIKAYELSRDGIARAAPQPGAVGYGYAQLDAAGLRLRCKVERKGPQPAGSHVQPGDCELRPRGTRCDRRSRLRPVSRMRC